MQLFSVDATIFLKKRCSDHKKLRKTSHKLPRKTQIHFSSLLPWASQTAKTEEIMFQNVAYRPTVYRIGIYPIQLIVPSNNFYL